MKKLTAPGLAILSAITGALFIYAAWTKLFPVQSLEFTIVERAGLSWPAAAVSARLLIAGEAALGLLILARQYGRAKWVLKAALLLTLAFSAYLLYLWATAGSSADCGCFGDAMPMSPPAALLKNALLISALAILIRSHNGLRLKGYRILPAAVTALAALAVFLLFPLPARQPAWLGKGRYKLELAPLYAPGKVPPSVDLRKGRHILACFTLTCPHCRIAAKKLRLMKERNPDLPVYMVLAGPDEHLASFFRDTEAGGLPYSRLRGNAFIELAGLEYPAIFWTDNAWVAAKADYNSIDQAAIERWLQTP